MSKYSNKYILETGIGLQDVDKLQNSTYFKQESERYLRGEITLDEFDNIITTYYKDKPSDNRSEEADKISIRIAQIISNDYFSFTVSQLLSIHKELFDGVYSHAGQLRDYNFTKNEWVLDGESVIYGDCKQIEALLQYDFNVEKQFKYNNLTINEKIEHFATFIANLWQIHPFEEGNTRTTAVFVIKYLRSLGFDITNDTFAKNSWYFRNALVRANYNNFNKEIYEDSSFLIKFLRNLLLGENNELSNREIHVATKKTNISTKESVIISLIKENPKITTNEIAIKTGVSLRTIKNAIKVLSNAKVIERVDGKRYGYWKINKL